jgi:hypothetical protein
LGKVFPVRHPGDERGANSPTAGRVVYRSYALRARVLNLAWCDGAEMNIFRRRTPARVASPAAVTYQEKRFFIIPTAARAGFPTGGVVDGCIRGPRSKTSHVGWFFGKLAVQSS